MTRLLAPFSLLVLISTTGIAQEGVVQKAKKPYVGADISLSQTVGSGTMSKNFAPERSLSTDLQLVPALKSNPFWGDRVLKASLEFYGSFEWLPKDDGKPVSRLSISDLKFRLQLKNALSAPSLGLTFTPGLKVEIPSSSASSIANRVVGLGTNLALSWTKWGITLSYKPTAIGYIHSLPYKSSSCTSESTSEDQLGNGQCKVEGRQTMLLVKNGMYAEYANGDHSILFGLKTFHGILRPTELAQKYSEASIGIVEYGYTLPSKLPMSLYVGVSSFNPTHDPRDGFRMPFFSALSAASNFTNIYGGLNVTL